MRFRHLHDEQTNKPHCFWWYAACWLLMALSIISGFIVGDLVAMMGANRSIAMWSGNAWSIITTLLLLIWVYFVEKRQKKQEPSDWQI